MATSNKSRGGFYFYSIFPPSFLFLAIGGLWGPGILISLLGISINVLINSVIALAILGLVLFLTKNSKLLTFKQVFITGLLATIASDLYSFFANPLLYYDPQTSIIPPFSYTFSPATYNFITQILTPTFITFMVLTLLLRRYRITKLILVSILTSILIAPWFSLLFLESKANIDTFRDRSIQLSQKDIDDLSKQVSSEIVGEKIVLDSSSNYKNLRVETQINVPQTGHYKISFHLAKPSTNPSNLYQYQHDTPLNVYVNGVFDAEIKGINLKKGKSEITFEFPYIYIDNKGDERVNLKFENNEIKGPYGPYKFGFKIEGFESPGGLIHINHSSEEYTTKSYQYLDFYK